MKLKLIFLFALLMVLMGCQAPRLEISIDGPTTIFEGETIQYAITFNPATTQKKLNWESSNPEVATVNENGQLIALVAGEIRLFARLQDNRQVYAYIDVTIKPLTMTIVGPREISAYESVSYTITFNPDSLQKTVNWESSNPKIATVNENGQLTGLKAGQVRLVARLVDNSNVNTYIDVTIKPLVIEEIMITGKTTLAWKESFTYSASCLPLYAPKQFQWSSSDEVIIAIDENGRAEARQIGEAIIRASSIIDPSVYKEVLVSVVHGPLATLVIEGGEEVYVGSTLALKAFDGHEDVSEYIDWTIDDEQKATINTRGIISGLVAGTVIVTATSKLNPELSTTKQITIVFRNYLYYQTKILMIDQVNYQMELLDCPTTKFSATTKVKQKLGDKIINLSLSDLMLGMENVYAQIDVEANLISALLIDGEIGFSNIRVGIRKAINDIALDATLYHDVVEFSVLENMVLKTFDGAQSLAISEGSNLTFTYLNGQIEVKRGNDIIMKTAKRLLLQSLGNNENIQFLSITRANGKPYYHGNMEVAIKNNRLLVVNDLNLEKYLYKVLPSEMPSSFGLEALKAQAIAARTYAYMDVFNKATQAYGYTVDDSVKSQVYNNQNTNEISKRAVNETAGQIMTYNGTPVSAYYYSTSSGLTASGHEVWISKQVGSEIPYLIGQNLAQDDLGKTISFDYRDEASMLAFFKTIKMKTPESALSKYHRWKVSFTKTQLTTTLNKNLKLTYSATPQLVLTKKGDSWLSQTIPSSIGDVTNIYVGERGSSGVVISLIVETTTGIYKIINQYNIRFTVRPKDAGSTVYRYCAKGTSTTYDPNPSANDSTLLSGFFAIEAEGESFVFYGGGYGHGVGMSQYGAYGLANAGKNYAEILSTYYSNIAFKDISYSYTPIDDYQEYFH